MVALKSFNEYICTSTTKKKNAIVCINICTYFNPFNASSSGMQQFLAPAVFFFLTQAPNIQSLSLNSHNFLISESALCKFWPNKAN